MTNETISASDGRRIRAVRVSADAVLGLMSDGAAFQCIESDIPADARVVGAGFDVRSDAFQITFEHSSFDMVWPGEAIPLVRPPVMRREAAKAISLVRNTILEKWLDQVEEAHQISHRAVSSALSEGYCSCGWVGPNRDINQNAAWSDACGHRDHKQEEARRDLYQWLLKDGMSDAEARGTAWP